MTRGGWIFGYGSLVWRPDFAHVERRPACVRGWTRRFWQASPDHRGTPDAPGRVVTLLPESGAICWGMAYRVGDDDWGRVLARLDHRERGGYRRLWLDVFAREDAPPRARALTYVATADNPNYLGPQPLAAIAAVARESVGPSGTNREYVLRLAAAIADIGADDPHVAAVAALVLEPTG